MIVASPVTCTLWAAMEQCETTSSGAVIHACNASFQLHHIRRYELTDLSCEPERDQLHAHVLCGYDLLGIRVLGGWQVKRKREGDEEG